MIGHSTIDVLIKHYAGWIDSETEAYESRLKEAFQPLPSTSPEQKAGKGGIGPRVDPRNASTSNVLERKMGQTKGVCYSCAC